jgi:hypothetical protein
MRFVNRTTASIAALTVVGVGIGGVAYADAGSSAASHHQAAAHSRRTTARGANARGANGRGGNARGAMAQRRHRLLARALHGEVVLGGKNRTVTVDVQRGAVTAVSSSSLTMASVDGFSTTYTITPQTKVRSMGKVLSIGDVKTGERAFVVAIKGADGSLDARAVRGVREPAAGGHRGASSTTSG